MILSSIKRIWGLLTEDRKHRAEENKVRAEEIKIITEELKYLKDYHKQEHLEQKKINESLQKQHEELHEEVIKLRELEERCLEDQRIIKEKYIVTLEKLIFKTKGKWLDDEV